MPFTTNSAYMNLPLPNVSQDPGPTWASDLNTCLTTIDQHNHAPGNGLPVITAGININADLPFNSFSAISLKTSRYTVLGSPASSGTDIGCTYVSGQDLWYNDTTGRQVQITRGGSVIGSSGNVTNLIAPAAITYVPGTATFVFSSSASVAANIDVAAITLRNATSGSNGVTIQPVNSTPSYTLTLPGALPSTGTALISDASGSLSFNPAAANFVPSSGSITTEQTFSATAYTTIPGTITTITTKGRPVMLAVLGTASTASNGNGYIGNNGGGTRTNYFRVQRNTLDVAAFSINNSAAAGLNLPPPGVVGFDVVASSSFTYKLQIASDDGTAQGLARNIRLIAYEI